MPRSRPRHAVRRTASRRPVEPASAPYPCPLHLRQHGDTPGRRAGWTATAWALVTPTAPCGGTGRPSGRRGGTPSIRTGSECPPCLRWRPARSRHPWGDPPPVAAPAPGGVEARGGGGALPRGGGGRS